MEKGSIWCHKILKVNAFVFIACRQKIKKQVGS